MIELLCVMTIILILVSLMLPTLGKALRKARGLGEHLGGPGGIEMRLSEVMTQYTRYRIANPNHRKLDKKAFLRELHLSATAEEWMKLDCVEFHPFASTDPADQPAIVVLPSGGCGAGDQFWVFAIGDLILPNAPE